MVLEGIIEKGNITCKSTQFCVYADDTAVIAKTLQL
jgi:hypothetical protein